MTSIESSNQSIASIDSTSTITPYTICKKINEKKEVKKVNNKKEKKIKKEFRLNLKGHFCGLFGSLRYKKKKFEAKLAVPIFHRCKIGIFCAYD